MQEETEKHYPSFFARRAAWIVDDRYNFRTLVQVALASVANLFALFRRTFVETLRFLYAVMEPLAMAACFAPR